MKLNLFFIFFFILASLYFVSSHIITPASFSFSPNVSSEYTITVNNTDTGENANVTQVNVTLPSGIIFTIGTNATDSSGTFTNTSAVLSWTNSSYLINESEAKIFQFDASATDFGNYNLTVTVVNLTGNYNYNISVAIEDTTDPSITFGSSTPSDDAELNQTFIPVEVSATDDVGIDTISVFLYNSAGHVSNTSVKNSSVIANFTGLSDGEYFINATANDTSGNIDSTSTRKITINTSSEASTSSNQTNNTASEICTPNWDCTDWEPEECPDSGIQTKTCTDLNGCSENSPDSTTRSCEKKESNSNLFPIIATLIVALIAIGGFVAYLYFRKQGGSESEEDNRFKKNFPPSTSPLKHTVNKPQIRRMFPHQAPRPPPRNPPGRGPPQRIPPMRAPPKFKRP